MVEARVEGPDGLRAIYLYLYLYIYLYISIDIFRVNHHQVLADPNPYSDFDGQVQPSPFPWWT